MLLVQCRIVKPKENLMMIETEMVARLTGPLVRAGGAEMMLGSGDDNPSKLL